MEKCKWQPPASTAFGASDGGASKNLRSRFRRGCEALCQRTRHFGRHPYLNDWTHGPVPLVEEMQADFHALLHESRRRQFRRSQVMRRRSSEFGDHGGPSEVTQVRWWRVTSNASNARWRGRQGSSPDLRTSIIY